MILKLKIVQNHSVSSIVSYGKSVDFEINLDKAFMTADTTSLIRSFLDESWEIERKKYIRAVDGSTMYDTITEEQIIHCKKFTESDAVEKIYLHVATFEGNSLEEQVMKATANYEEKIQQDTRHFARFFGGETGPVRNGKSTYHKTFGPK